MRQKQILPGLLSPDADVQLIMIFTAIIAVFFPVAAKAATDSHLTLEGVVYELNSNGTAEIVGYTDELPGRLTVPEQISDGEIDYTVTAVRDSAFLNSKIWWIDLPSSIRSIGTAAFQDPDGNWILDLMTLRSPESPELGDQVFFPDNYERCTNVYVDDRVYEKYATDPKWVKTYLHCGYPYEIDSLYYRILDREAKTAELIQIPQSYYLSYFLGYENVTDRLPDYVEIDGEEYHLKSIGDDAFRFSRVERLNVQSSINNIGSGAFYRSHLFDIRFEHKGESLELGNNCFDSTSLPDVEIPEGVEVLPWGMTVQCFAMGNITLPSTLRKVEELALEGDIFTVTINAIIPPIVEDEWRTFQKFHNPGCTLYIPNGTLQAYSEAEGWREFHSIVETGSGIDGVEADAAERLTVSGEVYSAAGARLRSVSDPHGVTAAGCCEGLPAGVYVVRLTDTDGRTTAVRTAVR